MFTIQIPLAQVALSDPTELTQSVAAVACFVAFSTVEFTVGFTVGERQTKSVGKPSE